MRYSIACLVILVVISFAQSTSEVIRMADQLIKVGDFEKAETRLRNALKKDPSNPDFLWRLGQSLNRQAVKLQGMARHDMFEESSLYLSIAVKKRHKMPEPHVELARTLGFMGLFKAEWDSYTLAGRIKEELDYAIRQDSDYADAYYIYGLWNRFVSTRSMLVRMPYDLGDASQKEALRYFKLAMKKDKDNALYQLECAKQHLELDNKSDAKKILAKTIKMKSNLFNKEYIIQAQTLLDTIE